MNPPISLAVSSYSLSLFPPLLFFFSFLFLASPSLCCLQAESGELGVKYAESLPDSPLRCLLKSRHSAGMKRRTDPAQAASVRNDLHAVRRSFQTTRRVLLTQLFGAPASAWLPGDYANSVDARLNGSVAEGGAGGGPSDSPGAVLCASPRSSDWWPSFVWFRAFEGRAGANWAGLEWHFKEKLSLIPVCIFSLGGAEEGVAALCST